MHAPLSSLAIVSLVCSAIAAMLIVGALVIRPEFNRLTKGWLFLGIGVFPIGAAFAGNMQGFETTEERTFCGSCHVMALHAGDSDDPLSHSLASRHARNPMFGADNCYVCHADYGMYGTMLTKVGGMRHVWLYYTQYRDTPLDEAKKTIHLRKPYPNENCMQCHSTKDDLWLGIPDHKASLDDVRSNRMSCASSGCHGLAHPFWKSDDELRAAAQTMHVSADRASDGGGL